MIKHLINLGLVLTCFAIWPGMDLRVPKEIAGLSVALAIGLYAIYSGSLKRFRNYWLLLFVGFYLFSMCNSPHFKGLVLAYHHGTELTLLGTRNMSGFWAFKPFAFVLVYLFMTIAIASIHFKIKEVRLIVKIMTLCGFLTALYIFIQAVHLDQFFHIIADEVDPQVKWMTKPLIGGFIGQPTVVAPFVAMLIPLALYLRRYVWAVCMIVAVCLTESKVGIGAMCISVPLYLLNSNIIFLDFKTSFVSLRLTFRCLGVFLVIVALIGAFYLHKKNPDKDWIRVEFVEKSSGRIAAWKLMWEDFTTPINGKKYCVTGFGPGAFAYMHSIRHNNTWRQAHNEPGEGMYNFGFAGMGILLMAIWWMMKNVYLALKARDELVWAFASSLICIFICSLGSFPLQGEIATTMWYTVVIIALFHNATIMGGYYAKAENTCKR